MEVAYTQTQPFAPRLIYCFDAYCGWCYGFSPVIKKIADEYLAVMDSEAYSGGMILTEKPVHIGATAAYIKGAYKNVEELTGVKFGEDYLWHINHPEQSDWYPHSAKPAIALCVFKTFFPKKSIAIAADIQYALHFEGRDLTDDEAYRYLLDKYGIDHEDFYEKLKSDVYEDEARYEFAICKQLQVTGFPAVFIQTGELKFNQIARGYTPYEVLKERIENVLEENK